MTHVIKDKAKLLARVRRLKGQMEAVERALEQDRPCGEVLNLVASIRGATAGLIAEMIEDHIRAHVAAPDVTEKDRDRGATELIDVIRKYLK
jgi:DNA-binding FrmR family transcriptional regulator